MSTNVLSMDTNINSNYQSKAININFSNYQELVSDMSKYGSGVKYVI